MSQAETTTDLRFDAPGPGCWKLDAVHFPRPVTRYWAETHPAPFRRGFADFTRFYGMLIDTLDTAYPNGFSYTMMRPAAPEDIPARLQRAEEVFEGKLWREQLREWDETVKPASVAAHRAIQSVDPDALDDEDLGDYLARCHEHHAAMITQHMRFTAAAMIPTGDFLAHVVDWTGLAQRRAARPAAGRGTGVRGRLARARAARSAPSPRTRAPASSWSPTTTPRGVLDELRALDGDAGAAVGAYLDLVG